LIDWPTDLKEDPIQVVAAEDGSGVGAALIAALTLKVRLLLLEHKGTFLTYL
jgi:hexokinase